MIDEAFSRALRRLRTQKQLSQEELALRAGLHRTYISQLERGLKTPSLKTFQSIAVVLGVDLVEFMRLIVAEIDNGG